MIVVFINNHTYFIILNDFDQLQILFTFFFPEKGRVSLIAQLGHVLQLQAHPKKNSNLIFRIIMGKENQGNECSITPEEEKALGELVEFVMLSLTPHGEEEIDPFEGYILRLKAHVQEKNPQAFKARFLKGYRVLLETVSQS